MLKHVWKSYRITQEFHKEFPVNQSSVEYRIAPLLTEANTALYSMLSILQQSPLNKKQLKYYLSVMFRDDEALDPLVRAWIRASTWMDNAGSDEIERKRVLLQQLKEELRQMVPYIEDLFGKEEAQDIIPPIYRPRKVVG